jgi:multidrug efflux system outer membrane protein
MQEQRVVALRQFAHHSKRRFDAGLAGYLDVLVAENELFAAELASVRTQADRYTQLVGVYQAVGGGWVDVAGSMAPKAQSLASAKH